MTIPQMGNDGPFVETGALTELAAPARGSVHTLHIRCGSDIRQGLRLAGVRGDFLEFADPVCQGPVPSGTGESFRSIRARHLAGPGRANARRSLKRRLDREQAGLWRAPGYGRIVIWKEHDPYDQMILVRLLSWFRRRHDCRDKIALLCIGDHPEVDRFIGLGQLSPRQLADLVGSEAPVTEAQFDLGAEAWAALRAPQPADLAAIAERSPRALPFLAPAIERYLQEYPWVDDGLSLTERLCLQCLAEDTETPAKLFGAVQKRDPLPFLGDAMFWPILLGLAVAARPAITEFDDIRSPVTLTAFGRDLLAGRADWVEANGIDRWHGGVHLTGHAPPWRWDGSAGTIKRA